MSVPIKFLHEGEWIPFEGIRNVHFSTPDDFMESGHRTRLEFDCFPPEEVPRNALSLDARDGTKRPIMLWDVLVTEFTVDMQLLQPQVEDGDLLYMRMSLKGGKLVPAADYAKA